MYAERLIFTRNVPILKRVEIFENGFYWVHKKIISLRLIPISPLSFPRRPKVLVRGRESIEMDPRLLGDDNIVILERSDRIPRDPITRPTDSFQDDK